MNNQIKIIRQKLDAYWKLVIDKELLNKLLNKFAPNYTIANLCSLWLIYTIKRGESYINSFSKETQTPFIVGDIYFGWWEYMFGWLWMYNYYWFSTQVVEWYTIYNTKISGTRIIWNVKLILKKQRKNFFYGWTTKKNWNYSYKIMTPERAFIQMLKEWKSFKVLPSNINKEKLLTMSEKNTSKNIYNYIKELCL